MNEQNKPMGNLLLTSTEDAERSRGGAIKLFRHNPQNCFPEHRFVPVLLFGSIIPLPSASLPERKDWQDLEVFTTFWRRRRKLGAVKLSFESWTVQISDLFQTSRARFDGGYQTMNTVPIPWFFVGTFQVHRINRTLPYLCLYNKLFTNIVL